MDAQQQEGVSSLSLSWTGTTLPGLMGSLTFHGVFGTDSNRDYKPLEGSRILSPDPTAFVWAFISSRNTAGACPVPGPVPGESQLACGPHGAVDTADAQTIFVG